MKIGSTSRGGSTPQKQGKAVEREVATLVGGSRIPMSGAVKFGPHNLTGDVRVPDAKGRELAKLEVKMTGTITPSGDASYTLKRSVLQQMINEAKATGELGALWLHWKHGPYLQDYVIIGAEDFVRLLDLAKIGAGEDD